MDKRTREELIAQNRALCAENADLKRQLADMAAEIEMLRDKLSGGGNGSSAAPFIKPNRQQRCATEREERKKRSTLLGASGMWQPKRCATLWSIAQIAAGSYPGVGNNFAVR